MNAQLFSFIYLGSLRRSTHYKRGWPRKRSLEEAYKGGRIFRVTYFGVQCVLKIDTIDTDTSVHDS